MIKIYFRIYGYAVTATPSSVIYFGRYDWDEEESDKVVEYQNLKWNLLGYLASPRYAHR